MKYFLEENVFDAGLNRIRRIFDEFEHVAVGYSGGKDSTVTLQLALRVAEEKGRLPLPVVFVDQEAEWQTVIDHIREVMNDPRVDPKWLQVPFKIFNATSEKDEWLQCWDPAKESDWMRPREPNSIHENVYGTDRFAKLFTAFMLHEFKGKKACYLAGVRASESPARHSALTSYATYKDITWGNAYGKKDNQYTFYPLYDWDDTDIWKAIHVNKWPYCAIYDMMYQQGVPYRQMRVSNLHHETAVKTLFYLQEIERETWGKLTRRLKGVNTAKHLRSDFLLPKELPFMFKSWKEYRDYLVDKLIENPDHNARFKKQFLADEDRYEDETIKQKLYKVHVSALLVNDYEGTKIGVFRVNHCAYSKNAGKLAVKHGIMSANEVGPNMGAYAGAN